MHWHSECLSTNKIIQRKNGAEWDYMGRERVRQCVACDELWLEEVRHERLNRSELVAIELARGCELCVIRVARHIYANEHCPSQSEILPFTLF